MNHFTELAKRIACGSFALSTGLALAQMGPPPAGGTGRHGAPGEGGTAREASPPTARQAVSDRLFQASMRLLLSREQAPAWERFRFAFLAARASTAQRPDADADLDTRQAVQVWVDAARVQHARMVELAAAIQALLATLDETQRQRADEVFPRLLLETLDASRAAPGGPARAGDGGS